MDFTHITQDERIQLYHEVWKDPVTVVAERYGISDNGLRKHLKRLWIPLPLKGYWAKAKSGQTMAKPDLPPVTGELKRYVRNYFIKYKVPIDELSDEELKAADGLNFLTDETVAAIQEKCKHIKVKDQLRNPHKLIEEHKEESAARRKRDKELSKNRRNNNYYQTVKSEYSANKTTLPIGVSDINLIRSYRILDTLFRELEEMEGGVRLSYGYENRTDSAYFIVLHTGFDFMVKEEKRKGRQPADGKEKPPRLVLSMQYGDNFSHNHKNELEYKDRDNCPLEEQTGTIIQEMFVAANKMLAETHLAYRKLDREWEEQDRQRHLEQMRKGELEDTKLLEQAAMDWDKAQRIRLFTDAFACRIADIKDTEKKKVLMEWLQWARDKADWLDPLTDKEDDLLGKSKYLYDSILEKTDDLNFL